MDPIHELVADDLPKSTLQPSTPVLGINRGRETLVCQYNGQHFNIPPGKFKVNYANALHFQRRLVVPGSRHLNDVQATKSWIGIIHAYTTPIIRIDPVEDCTPFTNDELDAMGLKVEGLDRETADSPAQQQVRKVSMRSSEARRAAGRGNRRTATAPDTSEQASPEAAARAAEAFTPPDLTQVEQDQRDAAAEGVADVAAARERKPSGGRRR